MSTQVETSKQVFEHHFGALGVGDLPDILSDFTERSMVIHPGGVEKGIEAIRDFYAPFLTGLLKPGTYEFHLDAQHVAGDVVFIAWHAHREGADITFASDTFVVRDGKIAVQTVAAKIEPHS